MQNLFSLLKGDTNFTVELLQGWKFKVRDMYDLLALKEVFGDEIYKPLFKDINKNTTLIDLGAYIGDTEIYAQQFPQIVRIIALEPMPENYNLTKHNLNLNKLKNVRFLQAAVARKKGKIDLYIHPNKGQSGFWKKSGKVKKIQVKTMTLTDIIDLVKTPNMILKCDCEGAEFEMFMNTPLNKLSKFQKMAFEYHNDRKLIQIIKRLQKVGFNTLAKKHPVEPNLGTAYAEKN